jgi:two-component system NtrC family sensor kinase
MSSGTPQNTTGGAGGGSSGTQAEVPQALRQLDRLANLGLFSASIAHEIKNGLVAVNTFCQVLVEKDENREMAEMVRRELKRIDGLVTQMLRLAAPKPPMLAPVNAHALLDLTLGLLEHQMSERMITLRRDYRADPAIVRADESLLQQALINLLLNAVEAMGQGGELTAATESGAGRLKISIRDTGAGIAPENFGHIFETFFTTKKHGTGLGLAISRRVVEEHQGTIEVQSAVGQGSTFCVILPAN